MSKLLGVNYVKEAPKFVLKLQEQDRRAMTGLFATKYKNSEIRSIETIMTKLKLIIEKQNEFVTVFTMSTDFFVCVNVIKQVNLCTYVKT